MPTYDYHCSRCGHELEAFHSMSADPLTDCPACEEPGLKRKIGTGAGLIFKGSGFYTTDYRSESYQKGVKAESGSKAPEAAKDKKPKAKTSTTN